MEHTWKAVSGSEAAARTRWFADLAALGGELSQRVMDGDLVLLKGSRGLELEKLLPSITGQARGAKGSANSAKGSANSAKGGPAGA